MGIDAIIGQLADHIGCPTAVDDPQFRLLHYSPQRGPLDQVRIDSILHRDSPRAAKAWVDQQGVREAESVCRVPGSADVGLLPRACAPIRHEGALLGFLWVIDAGERLTDSDLNHVAGTAQQIAPLLFRMRILDQLDRQRERETLQGLLSPEVEKRRAAALRLESSGIILTARTPRILVVEAVLRPDSVFDDSDRVGLETSLEQARSLIPESESAHVTRATQGIILLVGEAASRSTSYGSSILNLCTERVPNHRWVLGIGSVQNELQHALRSYREAAKTTRILTRVPELGNHLEHDDLGAYSVLANLPEEALTLDIVPAGLRHLFEHDPEGELGTTLACFLDKPDDMAAIARSLNVHRSTVYQRLRRIERTTGADLRRGDDRLTLHQGLALARLVGAWPRPDRRADDRPE